MADKTTVGSNSQQDIPQTYVDQNDGTWALRHAVTMSVSTSGGYATSRLLSAASTNATSVKATPGQVYGWYLYNTNAAVRFLKIYNKASAPTVGTDTPKLTLPIQPNAAVNLEVSAGIEFTLGIAFALTTGIADADVAAVAANEITVNLLYK